MVLFLPPHHKPIWKPALRLAVASLDLTLKFISCAIA